MPYWERAKVVFREGLGKQVIRSHGCREDVPLDVDVVSGEAFGVVGAQVTRILLMLQGKE
jgi:hypothetical protein